MLFRVALLHSVSAWWFGVLSFYFNRPHKYTLWYPLLSFTLQIYLLFYLSLGCDSCQVSTSPPPTLSQLFWALLSFLLHLYIFVSSDDFFFLFIYSYQQTGPCPFGHSGVLLRVCLLVHVQEDACTWASVRWWCLSPLQPLLRGHQCCFRWGIECLWNANAAN